MAGGMFGETEGKDPAAGNGGKGGTGRGFPLGQDSSGSLVRRSA